jgi:hypothetical protein
MGVELAVGDAVGTTDGGAVGTTDGGAVGADDGLGGNVANAVAVGVGPCTVALGAPHATASTSIGT